MILFLARLLKYNVNVFVIFCLSALLMLAGLQRSVCDHLIWYCDHVERRRRWSWPWNHLEFILKYLMLQMCFVTRVTCWDLGSFHWMRNIRSQTFRWCRNHCQVQPHYLNQRFLGLGNTCFIVKAEVSTPIMEISQNTPREHFYFILLDFKRSIVSSDFKRTHQTFS